MVKVYLLYIKGRVWKMHSALFNFLMGSAAGVLWPPGAFYKGNDYIFLVGGLYGEERKA